MLADELEWKAQTIFHRAVLVGAGLGIAQILRGQGIDRGAVELAQDRCKPRSEVKTEDQCPPKTPEIPRLGEMGKMRRNIGKVCEQDTLPAFLYDLFEQTRQNLIEAWSELAKALNADEASMFALRNGNLDTGKDAGRDYVCWA